MKEYFQILGREEDNLTRLVQKLQTTGLISMETADEINSLLPGEMSQINPDVEFDFDDSELGHGVALEAAMNGLDRVKIAFIVAAIAFILKYITSLGSNSTHSFAGGGAGGWGGSAPPVFKPSATPGSVKATEEEAAYNEMLVDDLAKNVDSFKAAHAAIQSSLTVTTLEGAKKTKAYTSLIKVLGRVYAANSDKEGFNIFGVSSPYDIFAKTDEALTSKQALERVPNFLKHINDQYTTATVLADYKGTKLKLLPYVVNKELAKSLKDLIAVGNKYIANPQSISAKLNEVVKINEDIARKQDPVGNADMFIKWVIENFIIAPSNVGAKNPLTMFIKDTLEVDIPGLEKINISTNIVGNTNFLNVVQGKVYLREVFSMMSGLETSQTGVEDDNKNTKLTDAYLSSLSKSGLMDVNKQYKLDEIAGVISDFQENLTDVGGVENLLETAKKYVSDYAAIAQDASDEKNRVNEDDERDVGYTKNLIHHQAYVQNAINCLVTIIAGYTNVSNQMTKFAVSRIEVYTKKLQAMNKDYYDLTQILRALESEVKP